MWKNAKTAFGVRSKRAWAKRARERPLGSSLLVGQELGPSRFSHRGHHSVDEIIEINPDSQSLKFFPWSPDTWSSFWAHFRFSQDLRPGTEKMLSYGPIPSRGVEDNLHPS